MKLSILFSCAFAAGLALARSHPNRSLASFPHHLVRRWDDTFEASDNDWNAAKCRGEKLINAMILSDAEAGPKIQDTKVNQPPSAKSEWQGELTQELKTWGWHEIEPEDDQYADMEHLDVISVTKALEISDKVDWLGGDNIPYEIEHFDRDATDPKGEQKYEVNDKAYTTTGARHTFTINPKDGVIIGQNLLDPATAAAYNWGRNPKPEELPKLQRLSDIFWGHWVRENPDISNIRYFWMMNVVNQETVEILARALHDAGKKYAPWPGTTFDMDSDAGKAILGSANGAVFAWFLIQHEEQLGNKWIPKVTVFLPDKGRRGQEAHLIFNVEKVPEQKDRS